MGRPVNEKRKLGRAGDAQPQRPVDVEEIRLRRAELNRDLPVPVPPFWGAQTIARVPVKAVVPYLNERMLYQFQWGYRKDGRSLAEYKEWAKKELRPVLARICDIAIRENILVPQAAYGYWRCAAELAALVHRPAGVLRLHFGEVAVEIVADDAVHQRQAIEGVAGIGDPAAGIGFDAIVLDIAPGQRRAAEHHREIKPLAARR